MITAPNRQNFVKTFGHLFEYSPWVVERAWDLRPFADEDALHAAFVQVVRQAAPEEQLGLIRAHPELGVKAALTAESESEQSGAGLKTLSAAEFEKFAALNATYKAKFGFPFIVCVRAHTKASILAAFDERLHNDPATEYAAALAEIFKITRLRLHDILLGAAA